MEIQKESGRRIDTRKFHAGERAKRTEQHLRRGGVKEADSRKCGNSRARSQKTKLDMQERKVVEEGI